jgi:hypothetical protein
VKHLLLAITLAFAFVALAIFAAEVFGVDVIEAGMFLLIGLWASTAARELLTEGESK